LVLRGKNRGAQTQRRIALSCGENRQQAERRESNPTHRQPAKPRQRPF
jgi:hypothetical protein